MVRRIEPPLRVEAIEGRAVQVQRVARISLPARDASYPVVGIIDGGVADVEALQPWGVGGAGVVAPADKDEIFVVSAGNLRGLAARPPWPQEPEAALEMLATRGAADERISAPGDHLYGYTIAALNPPGLRGVVEDVPTTYSRRGPGPGGARKPELCQIGGVTARDGNRCGLFSVGVDGTSLMVVAPVTRLLWSRRPLVHLTIVCRGTRAAKRFWRFQFIMRFDLIP